MVFKQIIKIQRRARALLSFPYNKEEKLTGKDLILIDELSLKAKKLLRNNNRKNYKKTHKIFSKETLRIILNKNLENFLQYSFIQKCFLFITDFFLKII